MKDMVYTMVYTRDLFKRDNRMALKERLNNKLNKIKKKFLEVPEKFRGIFSFAFLFASLMMAIPSGGLTSSAVTEASADYVASLVDSDYVDGDYISLIVESKDQAEYPLPTSIYEFYSLYNLFRLNYSPASYASTVNANKSHTIVAEEFNNNSNLSFLYTEYSSNSNSEYNGHWKHHYYPLELMFEGTHTFQDSQGFCYVSQSQADILLSDQGFEKMDGEYSQDAYESLIGTNLHITIDETQYVYTIGDVYYETDYFYEALNQTMGEFLLVYYGSVPSELNFQSLYFLNAYTFRNNYSMDHILSNFIKDEYDAYVNDYNLDIENIDTDRILSFYYNDYSSQTGRTIAFVFIIILSILCFLVSFILCDFYQLQNKYINILWLVVFAFAPYLIFKVIYLLSGNLYIFSSTGTIINLVFLLIYLFFYLFLLFKSKVVKKGVSKAT